MDLDPDKIAKSPFVVGLLGAVVALRGAPGDTWRERAFNIFCGAILAGYMSPALAEYFGFNTPAMHSASAFLVGLFGLNLVATTVQLLKSMTWAEVWPWRK